MAAELQLHDLMIMFSNMRLRSSKKHLALQSDFMHSHMIYDYVIQLFDKFPRNVRVYY